MPKMNGFDMLENLYQEKICIEVPKLLLTTEVMESVESTQFLTKKRGNLELRLGL